MAYQYESEAWKHFNNVYPHFSAESRSMRVSWIVFRWIQPIQVIYCSLFLLAGYTHSLQLAIGNVYEAGVHVFIYGHTRS